MDPRELQYQRNSAILAKYIPEKCVPPVAGWITRYDFKLKIRKERASRLGDYTPPVKGGNHVITVNHNLNRYAFFITLVHEVAHLVTFNEHRDRVFPHGAEWKRNFQSLMEPFLSTDIFPLEVFAALRRYMRDPAASSCSDEHLMRTLKLHDECSATVFLEYLPQHATFLYNGSRIFRKGEKMRKRFRCVELKSGAIYLFSGLAEVEPLDAGQAVFAGRMTG